MEEERRNVVRWEVNQPAEITVDEECARGIPCTIKDISIEGMCVSLPRRIFPEALSRINVGLSDALQFRTDTSVAWSEETEQNCCYGVCFNGIDDTRKDRICNYIENNFPGELRKQWWKDIP